ncbi:hypothetical protein BDY19DRAFT_911837 [Irpex rosettiformis]|uniref:Uncharacterized protein n=1 Tax=Irpex rosettiformis TaxID=378272 RepID=A0ACB8UJC1_9APHY|nr:hypothetical protein BDY19DRAFT_911837 [Irpex rosettiformis]
MLFGNIKSSSSSANTSSMQSDVFAVACDLQSQLHELEEWFAKGQEINGQLKDKKNELTEALRLFQIIEENEVNLTNDLEQELEAALQDMPYEDAAQIRLDPDANFTLIMEQSSFCTRMGEADAEDKENAFSHDRLSRVQTSDNDHFSSTTQSQKAFKPRVAIPPRWKKVIAMSIAAAVKDRQSPAPKVIPTGTSKPGSSSCTGATTPTVGSSIPRSLFLGDHSTAQAGSHAHTSPSVDTVSLVSSGGLCGRRGSRSKTMHASKSGKATKKKRRGPDSPDCNWSAKPYKTRKQSKVPHPASVDVPNTSFGSKPVEQTARRVTRSMGLGVLGGQWNSTANVVVKVDPEDEHRFDYMMSM